MYTKLYNFTLFMLVCNLISFPKKRRLIVIKMRTYRNCSVTKYYQGCHIRGGLFSYALPDDSGIYFTPA